MARRPTTAGGHSRRRSRGSRAPRRSGPAPRSATRTSCRRTRRSASLGQSNRQGYNRRARYPLRNWSGDVRHHHRHRRRRPRRLGDRRAACASAASSCGTKAASSSCSACRTRPSPTWRGSIEPGPWVAHVSGATPLAALDPARDGASACIRCRRSHAPRAPSSWTAPGPPSRRRRDAAHERATWLATTLGLQPFPLGGRRAHALPRRRGDRLELPRHAAIAPRRTLLERRGRAAGGARAAHAADDRERLRADRADRARRLGDGDAHLAAICDAAARARAGLPRARGGDGAVKVARTHRGDARARSPPRTDASASCRRWARSTTGTARCSTRRAPSATWSSSASSSTRRSSASRRISSAYPRDEERDLGVAEAAASTCSSCPAVDEMYPPGFQTWVDVAGSADPRGRPPARPLPRRGDGLPQALQHRPAGRRVLRPEGRAAGRGRRAGWCATSNLELEIRVVPTVRDADGLALSSRNALAVARRARSSRSRLPRALATRDPAAARARCSTASTSTTSRSPRSTRPVLAAAVRVGAAV